MTENNSSMAKLFTGEGAATEAAKIQPAALPAVAFQPTSNTHTANNSLNGVMPQAPKEMFEQFSTPYNPLPESVLLKREERVNGCWNKLGPHNFAAFVPAITTVQSSVYEEKKSYHHSQSVEVQSQGFSIGIGSIGFGFTKASSNAQLSETASSWVGWHFCNGVLMGWEKHCVNCEVCVPPHGDREKMLSMLITFSLQQNLPPARLKELQQMGLQVSSQTRCEFASSSISMELQKEEITFCTEGAKSTDKGNHQAMQRGAEKEADRQAEASENASGAQLSPRVARLLKDCKAEHLKDHFTLEKITIEQIEYLTDEDLKQFGATMGERRIIKAKAAELITKSEDSCAFDTK